MPMVEALFGILGVLLGSLISWVTSDRHSKIQTTLELHREFSSGDVLLSRNTAGRILVKYLDKPLVQFSASLEPEEYSHIWNIIHFYQRLWVSIKHKQVVSSMIPDLFGEVFMRWYIPYFETMLVPLSWSSSKKIKELRDWFESNSSQDDFREWIRLARQDREVVMQRAGLLPKDSSLPNPQPNRVEESV